MQISHILALVVSTFILAIPSADAAKKDIQQKKQNAKVEVKTARKSCSCSGGPRGPRGHKGERGPRGFTGATGAAGATGLLAPVNAASFYILDGSPNSTVGIGFPFRFDAAASPVIGTVPTTGGDITYSNGVFTFNRTGVYQFNYGASSASTGGGFSPTIALLLFDPITHITNAVAGSIVALGATTVPSNPSGVLTSGSVILSLTQGSTISLINSSLFSIALSSPGEETAIVAYIDIVEL